ncbi:MULTISPECIES: FadD3 family acyl-CoA ligase [unclassified Streptomyces]|uniref:FadD3 family acyl-CoA ligase n=1 Tax=unclassified Streptomyces TaxID=2593676 RepID=UPI00278C5C6E|nr:MULTISPECIES: FadD3 family acyl-CoA ligase [unclassified Streptomyces]
MPLDHSATVPAVLARAADAFPDAEALVDGDVRLTNRQLHADALAVTRSLLALGVRRGERVALWAPNSARWITAALGVLGAGAVLVPVNTRYKGDEARWVLERSRARLLLVENGFLGNDYVGMLDAVVVGERGPVPGLPELAHVVDLADADGGNTSSATPWPAFLRLGATVPAADATARAAGVREDDVSDVLFTSGTTGRPKGVMTTHRQNVRTYLAWSKRTGLARGDRYLIISPMFHCFGYKAGVLACLLRGATMVLQQVFDAAETLRIVEDESITVLPGPPTIFTTLLDAPGRDRHDLSSLRLAVTGAATVPVALVTRVRAELFPVVVTAYGLTESCGTVTVCRADDSDETIARTSGRPIDGVRVRVVDAARRPLPAGQDGEVLVRGYNVMLGYLDDPEATAEAVDDEGWLATGDVGHLDEDGRLTLTGRSKEMYVVGGFNVYPAEVEQLLSRHEAVAEAAVVGVPDERLGEVGRAYVTLRTAAETTPAELAGFCRAHLANFKVPREVVVLDTFPRNAAGKIRKTDLTDLDVQQDT